MPNKDKKGFVELLKNIWFEYWHDWTAHTKEELIIQVFSIIFILAIGMIAIKIIGKKSITQLTLPNVLFIFVLSSTLGALITKPNRILVALLVVVTIVIFVSILEKLQVKFNAIEKLVLGYPSIVYKNGHLEELELVRNNMTVDQLESLIRQQGLPSLEVCKTVILEQTGNLSIEVLPEYEPVKKIYFDKAMKDILKAIDDIEYIEAKPKTKNNLFTEAIDQKNQGQQNQKLD